jgi:hypothetical protein
MPTFRYAFHRRRCAEKPGSGSLGFTACAVPAAASICNAVAGLVNINNRYGGFDVTWSFV